MESQELSTEQMYRNTRKGWLCCLFAVIWPSGFAFLFENDFRGFDILQPFIGDDNGIVVIIAVAAAITFFGGAVYLKYTLTKKAVLLQNRELVLKGYIYGLQASGLITSIAFLLAMFFHYQYFIYGASLHFSRC
jgi:hypothetical protein